MNSILTKTILGDTTGAMASFGPILPALADVAAQRPPRVRDWTRRDDGYETDRHDRHYDRLRRVPSCSRRPSPAQPPPRPPSTAGPWSPPAPSPDTFVQHQGIFIPRIKPEQSIKDEGRSKALEPPQGRAVRKRELMTRSRKLFNALGAELSGKRLRFVTRCLRPAHRRGILADCTAAESLPLAAQEEEEKFDLALIASLEIDVVLHLRDSRVYASHPTESPTSSKLLKLDVENKYDLGSTDFGSLGAYSLAPQVIPLSEVFGRTWDRPRKFSEATSGVMSPTTDKSLP
ncbi:hypothetical protein K443DRAFT_9869 [Laccaria amethystina LaAM-08-1]|uniref:Uncharacterized protein n=1 Tax=Laccaria amethystina LaAM-08-1 TaxID=1095629 RepID=A0A0C9XIQ3_9AGAR|nr:hypothetical protein K443DRAFT_9869 [Laccaria amethystina LaAM-08-1]